MLGMVKKKTKNVGSPFMAFLVDLECYNIQWEKFI